ncbi:MULTISPECIES: DUF3793 family protein [Caproicibacterium]|uniref:DUF3793 family protein n=1 Tax=Caproicibacterium argilliputei TaxID=3030016 RepID=A0AA97D7T9_9FIRM|nr:DUF3793 family protein [Caproicibacterium argilliputei]WOC31826.1 DUF3793 family protein [Caproicibacterium argilliputei]
MENLLERALVEFCAPALAGVKPANLFSCRSHNVRQVKREARQWNRRLRPFGLSVAVLRVRRAEGSSLIYVYRPAQLQAILSDSAVQAFLQTRGYAAGGDILCQLRRLSERLRAAQEFPHEVGVFLGYPLRDVIGFVQNRGAHCTCCGTWKCYGDAREAQRYFARCEKCREIYRAMFRQGTPVLRLVVAA